MIFLSKVLKVEYGHCIMVLKSVEDIFVFYEDYGDTLISKLKTKRDLAELLDDQWLLIASDLHVGRDMSADEIANVFKMYHSAYDIGAVVLLGDILDIRTRIRTYHYNKDVSAYESRIIDNYQEQLHQFTTVMSAASDGGKPVAAVVGNHDLSTLISDYASFMIAASYEHPRLKRLGFGSGGLSQYLTDAAYGTELIGRLGKHFIAFSHYNTLVRKNMQESHRDAAIRKKRASVYNHVAFELGLEDKLRIVGHYHPNAQPSVRTFASRNRRNFTVILPYFLWDNPNITMSLLKRTTDGNIIIVESVYDQEAETFFNSCVFDLRKSKQNAVDNDHTLD